MHALPPPRTAAGDLTGAAGGLTVVAGGLTGAVGGLTGAAGGLTVVVSGLTGAAGGRDRRGGWSARHAVRSVTATPCGLLRQRRKST